MPWSNQSGGGGGWKGGGPWGDRPGGGTPQSDIEEMLKRGQDRFKQVIPGGGMNRGLMFLLGVVGLAAAAFYLGTVRVNPDEIGVVTRFGKFDRQLSSGLNLRLPYPVEEVYLPKVTAVNRVQIGVISGGRATSTQGGGDESLMLTGDENIVDIDFVVFWTIKDAAQFLFNVKDGESMLRRGTAQTVKDIAESSMREVVGKTNVQDVLTERKVTEDQVKELMQRALDAYRAGVLVTQVQLLAVEPPSQVLEAFRDVQAARADQDRAKNEAEAYRNSQVPLARGDAERIKQEAEGYKQRVVAEANGQTSRFLSVYEEYKKAPDVTRQRMFLETMERVMGGMDKIVIDQKGGGSGVVPFLPLNELTKRGQPAGGQ